LLADVGFWDSKILFIGGFMLISALVSTGPVSISIVGPPKLNQHAVVPGLANIEVRFRRSSLVLIGPQGLFGVYLEVVFSRLEL
jgi:hypothetical protein